MYKVKYDGLDKWYQRGTQAGQAAAPKATKFREGACENCGAMGHTRKDCLEKPRKRLAKYGGGVVAADDVKQPELNLSFDGKRDRWNGIDIETHQERLRGEFDKLEEARRLIKAKVGVLTKVVCYLEIGNNEKILFEFCLILQALDEEIKNATTEEEAAAAVAKTSKKREKDSDDEEEDEDKYAEEMELPGQKLHLESKQRISVRNLRMREDTAKYLLNLDPNSAYYDPKSRSMRDNPFKTKEESSAAPYMGDNFVRYSGEANRFARSQLFAWEAYEKGVELHQQAEPTKLELLHKEFKNKYEDCAKKIKSSVLEKYGGEEHLDSLPRELVFAQTENYVEYSRYGNVVKTQEKAVVKSKYVEDELRFGHSSVWGSYYADGKWGYKCCCSFDRNAYCKASPDSSSPVPAVVQSTTAESVTDNKE